MYTQAPDITVSATVGEVVSVSTPSPTASPSTIPSSPSPTPVYTLPTPTPIRQFSTSGRLYIYGYGPVNSKVSLRGLSVSEVTTSNETGYFKFSAIYSNIAYYPELCLQAVDKNNRVTQAVCIPALPVDREVPFEVGPILLPPTISLSDNKVNQNGEAVLEGVTSPNLKVKVYLSKNRSKAINLIQEVNAYSFPIIDVQSDDNGSFSLYLPTSNESDYKIFAFSQYNQDLSAKSTTLQFSVIGSVKSFFQKIWQTLLNNKILTFVMVEILIVIVLLIMSLKRTTKRSRRHTEKDYLRFLESI